MEPTTTKNQPAIECGCCGSTVGYMIPNGTAGYVCQDARACLARAGVRERIVKGAGS